MTVTHRSIGVAVESTFASIATTSGLPSFGGLSYVSIPCERDPIIIAGEPVASERLDARDGNFNLPPEPDTMYSGGSRVRRRTGQVVVRVDLTTIGTTANFYTNNYLGFLLGAGLKTRIPTNTHDAVASIANTNTYAATSAPAEADVGTLIGAELAGRAEYSAITDNDEGGSVKISPALSAAFTGTPTIRHLQTWFMPGRNLTGTREHSLSFRVDGVNFRSYAYGCVLESLNISLDSGRLMAEFTYQAAVIQDDHGNAQGPFEPVYNTGAAQLFRGAYVVASTTSPTSLTNATTGDTLARTELAAEDFSLSLTNTLTPLGHSSDLATMSGMDITESTVELSLTLSTVNTAIADDYFNRTVRQVVVGTGPIGDGLGCAIMLPAAMLTNDPSAYDVSGNDIVRQQLTYQQSRFGGDVVETNAGNSPFRIGLGI
ncbi:hypothetical protein [uncultured Idiomarina sp.]|uniref:hypothetical protein n=1 Tax=uncultured Idiomarina sp. TaxID=352961 RepID=UPI0032B1A4AB|tara:strand:- start:2041 stop:3333 length:1293 start_codon:yes stop_codon:yes gene_type:complete